MSLPTPTTIQSGSSTVRHIAIEGRCFFLNCDMLIPAAVIPGISTAPRRSPACRNWPAGAGSCIVDPRGHYVVEPVWDREAILTADLDMSLVPASRMEFDPCGHYARPDVLELTVQRMT